MNFKELDDIKEFMQKVRDIVGDSSQLYKDLDWFSSINYTTRTEYLGELKIFLEKIIDDKEVSDHKNELCDLIRIIKETLTS